MRQSSQSQKELIPVTSLSLQKFRDYSKPAILAFLEYIETIQEEIGKQQYVSFDTGDYFVNRDDLNHVLLYLAQLLNEALRKKTLARMDRKPTGGGGLTELETFVLLFSPYLGFTNLVAYTQRGMFSLAFLLHERPGGLLEPLTDEEWQTLSDKAVAAMLNRRQPREEGHYYPEIETNFADGRSNVFNHATRYRFANNEAKRAAEAIVASEKVRLNLFLAALQGTLWFLDRLTRLSYYKERQIRLDDLRSENLQSARRIASEIISIFQVFVDEGTNKQEALPQQQETSVIKPEPVRVVESSLPPSQPPAQNQTEELLTVLVEDVGAVITLNKRDAALVVFAPAKYKRKKVTVTTARGLEIVAYLAQEYALDADFCVAIFPRVPLQEGTIETVEVACDKLSDIVTLVASNLIRVFLEEE